MSVNLSVVHHYLMASSTVVASCRWVVNSKTCSRSLTVTYNMNYTCPMDALINTLINRAINTIKKIKCLTALLFSDKLNSIVCTECSIFQPDIVIVITHTYQVSSSLDYHYADHLCLQINKICQQIIKYLNPYQLQITLQNNQGGRYVAGHRNQSRKKHRKSASLRRCWNKKTEAWL